MSSSYGLVKNANRLVPGARDDSAIAEIENGGDGRAVPAVDGLCAARLDIYPPGHAARLGQEDMTIALEIICEVQYLCRKVNHIAQLVRSLCRLPLELCLRIGRLEEGGGIGRVHSIGDDM